MPVWDEVNGYTVRKPTYTYTTTGTTYWNNITNDTFVTKDELRDELNRFAKEIFHTLQAIKYLNKDISEDELMDVLTGGNKYENY
jgi:hypothetical protein